MGKFAQTHRDLEVYQKAFEAAVQLLELSRTFPKEETYSLTDQVRRSSRSVCANVAEAWRKRRYEKSFVNKLSDAESEAAETQVWLEFAARFGYLDEETTTHLYQLYDEIIGTIVGMINYSKSWTLKNQP